MPRDFFDPTPEQQNVVPIDAAILHKAEKLIESCEHCNPDSQATDVWALGVIAYEMLIGAHPFVTGSEASWQKAIFKGCFTSVRAHRQDVSPNWQAFFERVFQPEPKQRIGSAGIFLAELLLALKSADQKTKANS